MLNMVIHHLDTDCKNFPNFSNSITKIAELCKPGGKICINHAYKENHKSIWYWCLSDKAFKLHI